MTCTFQLPEKIEAVFFDMDGVLYDSMRNHATTWVQSFKQAGVEFPEYDAYLNEGRTGPSTIEVAFLKYGNRPATAEDIRFIYDTKTNLMLEAPEPPCMPNMQEVMQLTRAAGKKIMIVTGSKQPSLLSRLKDDYQANYEQIISGFDVKHGKPNPEPYLRALEKTDTKPENALVIENAPLGIESAKAAGIITIAVNTGILKDEILHLAGADMVLPGTNQLFTIWSSILEGR